MIQSYKSNSTELTWDIVKEKLQEIYGRDYIQESVDKRFFNLRQTGSIEEYNHVFNNLRILIPDLSERLAVSRYMTGLKQYTRVDVENKEADSVFEAMTIATRLENRRTNSSYSVSGTKSKFVHEFIPDRRNYYQNKSNEYSNGRGNSNFQTQTKSAEPMAMDIDSINFKKRLTEEERNQLKNNNMCFYCRKVGHFKYNCTSRKGNVQNH
ncbi:hypothetical protein AYI69_g4648 [Smittium culicis]|uniref:Ty3 transposon capsid-like protein domain-containing protein n=1 Tax=Smittium culicis TaxID=133412 RepID=A0A1R1YBX3_9FUNG|nr:hypothetical protein AYI69_g4648 [Smittium culicis]